MKFNWMFKISEDEKDLEIHLNDGINVLLEIEHEKFYQFLAEKMTEIMQFEHEFGSRTKVKNVNAIHQAVFLRSQK